MSKPSDYLAVLVLACAAVQLWFIAHSPAPPASARARAAGAVCAPTPAGTATLAMLRSNDAQSGALVAQWLAFEMVPPCLALLLLTSATGLALLVWRDTGAMALLLAVHLGVVMALFLTLPYGKFAHGIYRSAALLKFAIEKRQPNRLALGAD